MGTTLTVVGATTLNSTLNCGAIVSTGEIRSMGTSFVGMGASWDHFRIWHDGGAMYFDAGGSENGIVWRIDNTSSGYPAPSYPEKMRLSTAGLLTVGSITTTGNCDFGGTIAITGANANFGGSVDAGNISNTYLSFKDAGASSDWCYLRQIGSSNAYKLALDFMDDGDDARFCIRNNKSTDNPDTITEVFTVNNGNISNTGTLSIAGATTLNSTLSVTGVTNLNSTTVHSGEIQIKSSSVINFGSDQTKTDGATGRIGYGTYEANALCIVGGSTSGSRKVTIWDYLQINGLLTINGSLTMPNGSFFMEGIIYVKEMEYI